MQTAARNNLILTGCSSYAGLSSSQSSASRISLFLQLILNKSVHSVHSRQDFRELTDKLVKIAEYAYSLRDMETVGEAGSILINLPLEATRQIGQYYRSLYLKRNGQIDKAQLLLETVAREANTTYRARATQTLGTIYHEKGSLIDALRLYLEAVKITSFQGSDLQPAFMTHLQLSFIRSDSGDHQGALNHLQRLSPLLHLSTRHIPFYFYVYHADLAYELAQVGRLDEAAAAVSIALNSPFAPAYPEWSETRDEIAVKRQVNTRSHSQIAVHYPLQPKPSLRPESGLTGIFATVLLVCKRDHRQAACSIIAAGVIARSCTFRLIERLHRCVNPRSPPALP